MSTEPRDANTEGERVAKVIARAGICSRRDAEALIDEGRVKVNGERLTTPAVVVGSQDAISVDDKPIPQRLRTRAFLFHKPRGLVTTNRDPEGRRTIFDALPQGLPRVVTVGRLDINTEGLLILTNDGGLARVLELPATGWTRKYRVRVHGRIDEDALATLSKGTAVDGVLYGPIAVSVDRAVGDNSWLTVALAEGKNREVKVVLGSLGLSVSRLIRVSFGPFQLGDLPRGEVREVPTRQLQDQLGPRLAEEAGADFQSPIAAPAVRLAQKGPRPAGSAKPPARGAGAGAGVGAGAGPRGGRGPSRRVWTADGDLTEERGFAERPASYQDRRAGRDGPRESFAPADRDDARSGLRSPRPMGARPRPGARTEEGRSRPFEDRGRPGERPARQGGGAARGDERRRGQGGAARSGDRAHGTGQRTRSTAGESGAGHRTEAFSHRRGSYARPASPDGQAAGDRPQRGRRDRPDDRRSTSPDANARSDRGPPYAGKRRPFDAKPSEGSSRRAAVKPNAAPTHGRSPSVRPEASDRRSGDAEDARAKPWDGKRAGASRDRSLAKRSPSAPRPNRSDRPSGAAGAAGAAAAHERPASRAGRGVGPKGASEPGATGGRSSERRDPQRGRDASPSGRPHGAKPSGKPKRSFGASSSDGPVGKRGEGSAHSPGRGKPSGTGPGSPLGPKPGPRPGSGRPGSGRPGSGPRGTPKQGS